jgi:hypothetical protein
MTTSHMNAEVNLTIEPLLVLFVSRSITQTIGSANIIVL